MLKENILAQYEKQNHNYELFRIEMEHQIKSILNAKNVTFNAVDSRLKTKDSIAEKFDRKNGKYGDLTEITDIVGIRIITYYAGDVDKISEIIEQEFKVDKENSIDKRKSMEPDRFGYCSVHYVVEMSDERISLCENLAYKGLKCEIQIRSVLQHAWAEIEHDIGYKSEITIPKEMRRNFSRIAGLLEIADKEFDGIKAALDDYRNEVEEHIENEEFLNRDLDAVLLQTLIEKDKNIRRLNTHIESLVKSKLDKNEDNESYESSIQKLSWFGITTARQVAEMFTIYTSTAMEIANVLLNEHSLDNAIISRTVAYFYLCYAILLKEHRDENFIFNYLNENDIGSPEERLSFSKELLSIELA